MPIVIAIFVFIVAVAMLSGIVNAWNDRKDQRRKSYEYYSEENTKRRDEDVGAICFYIFIGIPGAMAALYWIGVGLGFVKPH